MSEATFQLFMFQIVDLVTRSELNNRSKQLIRSYFESSHKLTHAERAREAIYRYCQAELPTVAAIRAKHRSARLDALDHLVLRLEHEGARLDELER